MKRIGKIAVCLAGALALNAGSRGDDVALPGNPYAPVVARNVFGLNPVTVVDTTPTPPEPPVKITPNGIMSIFGQLQVLFKAASTPVRGKPAVEQSYILSEGQRQDDIEVVHIDEKKSLITFNNHGLVQELPLADASAASAGSPASGIHPVNQLPSPTLPGAARIGNRFNRGNFGGGRGGNFNNANNNNANDNGPNLNSAPTRNYSTQQQEQVTPEQQTLMIEAEREHYQQIGSPIAQLLPPTDMTPPPPAP